MGGFYQPQFHPHFGFEPMMLFQSGTAYDAAKRAYSSSAHYVPRTVQGLPQRPLGEASGPIARISETPVTAAPQKSRIVVEKPVTKQAAPTAAIGHKCAGFGRDCDKNVPGKQQYCATCRKAKSRAEAKPKRARERKAK